MQQIKTHEEYVNTVIKYNGLLTKINDYISELNKLNKDRTDLMSQLYPDNEFVDNEFVDNNVDNALAIEYAYIVKNVNNILAKIKVLDAEREYYIKSIENYKNIQ